MDASPEENLQASQSLLVSNVSQVYSDVTTNPAGEHFVTESSMAELECIDLSKQLIQAGDTASTPVLSEAGANADAVGMGHFVADAVTLQSLIATGAVQITDANGQPLDFNTTESAQVFQLLNSPNQQLSLEVEDPSVGKIKQEKADGEEPSREVVYELPPLPTQVPPGTPNWAARLRDLEKIGDYYRGWVENDIELDLLLTYHKQQTQSTWGTRQSPCGSKPATRLMWKSQYAPFDGIPFINAGSRAIVMECQYGPRRKGAQARKDINPMQNNFKKTCPARIYVKKVKKFVEYQVDICGDKKLQKLNMDRAFQLLKEREFKAYMQERYYVQLPSARAHENHSASDTKDEGSATSSSTQAKSIINATVIQTDIPICSRLHPLVQEKIRSLVANGETRLYAIRKQLRKYVEKEMFQSSENVPERHNLTYFPTVHDLQNHIHQALLDIEQGLLQVNPNNVSLEVFANSRAQSTSGTKQNNIAGRLQARAVTVTYSHTLSGDETNILISKVETQLSDGSLHLSGGLSPSSSRLLEKLHPHMFPLSNILQHVSLAEGQQTSVRLDIPENSAEALLLAAAATQQQQEDTNPDQTAQQTTENTNEPSQAARLIAASSDQSGYALVQTETGALLLAKGNASEGYHILGQAGANINADIGEQSNINLLGSSQEAGVLSLGYGALTSDQTVEALQADEAIHLAASLDAGDSAQVLSDGFDINSIKSERGSGDHL